MNKYKREHRKLQAWESILRDEYNRGTLSKELFSKLQAQGMTLAEPAEPNWEVMIEERPAIPRPLSPPTLEEAPADNYVDQESVALETPQPSPTAEEAVDAPTEEDPSPGRGDTKAEKDESAEVEVAEKEREGQGGMKWEREGYGICIGCAVMYILRCNGEESPWARGSDEPTGRDGQFFVECGVCQGRGKSQRTAKKKAGFGTFGSVYEDAGAETGHRASFRQVRLSPETFYGAEKGVIASVVRGREVKFVTVNGGVAFLEMEELVRGLPKGAEVGIVQVDLYRKGHRTGLIGRGIGGFI